MVIRWVGEKVRKDLSRKDKDKDKKVPHSIHIYWRMPLVTSVARRFHLCIIRYEDCLILSTKTKLCGLLGWEWKYSSLMNFRLPLGEEELSFYATCGKCESASAL